MHPDLHTAQRIVIKIGSALIAEQQSFRLRRAWLTGLAEDIYELRKAGKEVILVSSGAVTLARGVVDKIPAQVKTSSLGLETKQALASCGQIMVASAFRDALSIYGLLVGQMLLTLRDSEDRRSYLNARATITELLEMGVVPVINENDSVTTEQLRVGDNDRLAARVAELAGADLLVLLSDVDGLYTADPSHDDDAEHVPEVMEVTPKIEAMAGGPQSTSGTGGMQTKLMAAKIATNAGCHMVLMDGTEPHPLRRLRQESEQATWFTSQDSPSSARKSWILGSLSTRGRVQIDAGAVKALSKGSSLLAVGITSISGAFSKGDALSIIDPNGEEIARGLCGYDSREAGRIIGKRSDDIHAILGYEGRNAFIHRDDLVMF